MARLVLYGHTELRKTGIHISFFFFLKLVIRARMSEKILALTKFYSPIQNCVIILKYSQKLKVNKYVERLYLFSLCYCSGTAVDSCHFHFTNSTTRTKKIDLLCIDLLRLLTLRVLLDQTFNLAFFNIADHHLHPQHYCQSHLNPLPVNDIEVSTCLLCYHDVEKMHAFTVLVRI